MTALINWLNAQGPNAYLYVLAAGAAAVVLFQRYTGKTLLSTPTVATPTVATPVVVPPVVVPPVASSAVATAATTAAADLVAAATKVSTTGGAHMAALTDLATVAAKV